MPTRFFDWLDARTGHRKWLAPLRERVLPRGPSWTHTTAACLAWLLLVEMATGFLLMASYSPSTNSAWASVHFIEHSPGGTFIRGLHHYTSQAIIILFGIHLLRALLVGAFRKPRELIWLTGLLLMPLLIIWAITGNPLAGTQKGVAQIEVEGNIIGSTPLIGPILQRILIGGTQVGHLTYTHLYFLHVGLMPLVVLSLLALHLTQVIRHGVSISETTGSAEVGNNALAKPYFPYQTIRNMIVLAMILGTIASVSLRQGAPLDAPADPMLAQMPRPEWYFLFLFELRRYFAGDWEFVATIVIPVAALAALASMPLLDRVCLKRWSAAVRFVTVVAGGGAWAALTLTAAMRDWDDPEYLAATRASARLAARARVLADRQAIGPEGAAALLRDDPLTQGPLLFVRHCGSCHSHVDAAGQGLAAAEPSAPNLYSFASRTWLAGLFDPQQISSDRYFGKTAFAKGDMVSTVRSAHSQAAGPEEKAELHEHLQKMVVALSAEAQLPSQRNLDRADAETIAAGRKLLAGNLECLTCHKFHQAGELGTAPDLTGYGSREWLLGMIGNPQHERFYDAERNDRMPSFAKDPHDPQSNLLSPRELNLLVDWLRGEWYEPAAESQSATGHAGRSLAEAGGNSK